MPLKEATLTGEILLIRQCGKVNIDALMRRVGSFNNPFSENGMVRAFGKEFLKDTSEHIVDKDIA